MSHTSSATWISPSDRDQVPETTPQPRGYFHKHPCHPRLHSCTTCCNSFSSCNKIRKTKEVGRCLLAPSRDLQVTYRYFTLFAR